MCLRVDDQSLALHAERLVRHELAGQERILAQRLEVASGGHERDLVDHRRVEDVLVGRPALAADHDAVVVRRRAVERRRQADRRRQPRLLVAEAYARGAVGLAEGRDAEALDAVVDARLADAARDAGGSGCAGIDHGEGRRQTGVAAAELRIGRLCLTVDEPNLLGQCEIADEAVKLTLGQRAADRSDRRTAEARLGGRSRAGCRDADGGGHGQSDQARDEPQDDGVH